MLPFERPLPPSCPTPTPPPTPPTTPPPPFDPLAKVLEGYRRNLYSLRRLMLSGSPEQRQRAVHLYLQVGEGRRGRRGRREGG